MNCPKCGNGLKPENYENVTIDRCLKCKGAWLDDGEIKKIIETKDETFDYQLINETIESGFAGVPENDKVVKVNCPKCNAEMTEVNYDYSSGIILDRCMNCKGLWLDEKELEKVQITREYEQKTFEKEKDKWIALLKSKEYNRPQEQVEKGIFGLRLLSYKIAEFLTDR